VDFKKELNLRTEEINNILDEYMPKTDGKQKTVIDAMNYSISAGGKRLRPMLMNETFKLFGGEGDVIKPFMAAIEMIHTYSLVHDDLPAMDNDEYRRGKKTTHVVYGEAMGILAGDALLNYAFETASSAFDILFEKKVAKALKILSEKSGIYGMIGGQVVDIESEGKKVGTDTLEFVHANKTGALIVASMQIGAVLAGADRDDENKIVSIASDIGFAFQIQDDILDITSTTETLGKPVGSDEKNEKITYVSLNGIDKAKKEVATLSERALNKLSSFENKNEFLAELIKMLIKREK